MSFLSVTAQTKSCAQLLRNITFIVDFLQAFLSSIVRTAYHMKSLQ